MLSIFKAGANCAEWYHSEVPFGQIIVVSAVDDENVSNMAKGLGAADYVTKPLTLQDIDRVVLSRLKK